MGIPYIFSAFLVLAAATSLRAVDFQNTGTADSLGKPSVYYSAPLEKLVVVPTKESVGYTGISYVEMERMARFIIAEAPEDLERFKRIKTVVIDYGEKDAESADKTKLPTNPKDPVRNQWYISLPKRYFLTLKFYDCQMNQIGTPSFQISTTIPVDNGIGPFEAFKLMMNEAFLYLFCYPDQKNIVLKLG